MSDAVLEEIVLVFARAHVATLRPKRRATFLQGVVREATQLSETPRHLIRDGDKHEARKAAAEWFKEHMADLLL